jgi:hypothetical protein
LDRHPSHHDAVGACIPRPRINAKTDTPISGIKIPQKSFI